MEVKKTEAKSITTIKLSGSTKNRLDNLKLHPKETYEEILSRMLEILNLCRINPLKARAHLLAIDKQRKYIGGLLNAGSISKRGALLSSSPNKERKEKNNKESLTLSLDADDEDIISS